MYLEAKDFDQIDRKFCAGYMRRIQVYGRSFQPVFLSFFAGYSLIKRKHRKCLQLRWDITDFRLRYVVVTSNTTVLFRVYLSTYTWSSNETEGKLKQWPLDTFAFDLGEIAC